MGAASLERVEQLVERTKGTAFTSSVDLFPSITGSGYRLVDKIHRGKVRDSYIRGSDILVVATDRISTFDVVHPNGVPGKGIYLTQMTVGWLEQLQDTIPNHLIASKRSQFPTPFCYEPRLDGRTILVKKLHMLPIEAIVRGYITGSAWKEYKESGTMAGELLPAGLRESQKFVEPIFTPSTKAEEGHDENITFARMTEILSQQFPGEIGESLARQMRDVSLELYAKAEAYARPRGVVIADTKFEFGVDSRGRLVLADEVLTPDSSRFWPEEDYEMGRSQSSFDKQYVRDWATGTGWNKKPPAPELPLEVIAGTKLRYYEAYRRLFG